MSLTPPDQTDPDAGLVRRAQAGELAAFEELVTRYERQVYTLARRITGHDHDAEDVTQQAFSSAIDHLAGFRAEASFKTWLLRITANAALKILRKRKGLPTVSLEAQTELQEGYDTVPHPEIIADWQHSPAELVAKHETMQMIEAALEELDEKHRLVFLLRDVQGLSTEETAEALGISPANVKVRLLRARLQLREKLTMAFGDLEHRFEPHRHE